jgi:hypothetical protein
MESLPAIANSQAAVLSRKHRNNILVALDLNPGSNDRLMGGLEGDARRTRQEKPGGLSRDRVKPIIEEAGWQT